MQHLIHGAFVEIPFFAVSPVLIRDLPLLFGRVLPQLKTLELRFGIDMDPEFENDRPVIDERLFKLVDLAGAYSGGTYQCGNTGPCGSAGCLRTGVDSYRRGSPGAQME